MAFGHLYKSCCSQSHSKRKPSCDLRNATKARVGSGHETTNRSVGRAHGCMTWRYFIVLFSIKTADSAQPRNRSMVTIPFPRERVGSGHENTLFRSASDVKLGVEPGNEAKQYILNEAHIVQNPRYFGSLSDNYF